MRHLQVVIKILQYLKSSLGRELLIKKESKVSLEVYTHADYVGLIIDRRSNSGYCMFLGGNLVILRSKKQNRVARSSVVLRFKLGLTVFVNCNE